MSGPNTDKVSDMLTSASIQRVRKFPQFLQLLALLETVQLVTMKYFYVIIEIWCWACWFHAGIYSMHNFAFSILGCSGTISGQKTQWQLTRTLCLLFVYWLCSLSSRMFVWSFTCSEKKPGSLEMLKITLYPVLLSFNGLKQTLQHLRWCDAILVSLWELKAQETYNFPL